MLAITWLLTGVGYHWLNFSSINKLAVFFGALFVIAGVLFAVEGSFRDRIQYRFAPDLRSGLAILLIVYALVAYPLVGLCVTAPWPETPVFGIAPCPTTIFTLGMLLVAQHRNRWLIALVPVLWALVGSTAAFMLDIPQDYGLAVAAVIFIASERMRTRSERRSTT